MESTKTVRYAEAWAGTPPNAAHLNLAIGLKGGPIEQAFLTALASPRSGNMPFLTVLQPNWPIKPYTLFVNKADLRSEEHARLTWGPAQAGLAEGLLAAVRRGIIPAGQVDDYLVIAAVWVDWQASNDDEIYQNNREAALRAMERAFRDEPHIEDILALPETARNPFLKH